MSGRWKRMWFTQPGPYSKSNTGCPLRSMQTARGIPWAAASASTWLPNWASTSTPTRSFGTPPSMASSRPW